MTCRKNILLYIINLAIIRKMSCSGCGSDFGIFKKEHSCKQCGFTFCAKCLSKKVVVPKIDDHKHSVCNTCYEQFSSGKQQTPKKVSPPLAFKKRVQALSNNASSRLEPRPSVRTVTEMLLSDRDKEIAERLQRLKRDRAKDQLPSQTEIEERLAKLKGIEPSKFTAPPIMVYRPPDKRSHGQQAGDLLKQYKEEVDLDALRPKPEDEIAVRLARLRGVDSEANTGKDKSEVEPQPSSVVNQPPSLSPETVNLVDDYLQFAKESSSLDAAVKQEMDTLSKDSEINELIQKAKNHQKDKEAEDDENEENSLIEKLLAESALEESFENDMDVEDSSESAPNEKGSFEELPWCSICTEDARIQCFGCDGDIYCLRCFKECHDSLDIKDHKTCPYKPPKA